MAVFAFQAENFFNFTGTKAHFAEKALIFDNMVDTLPSQTPLPVPSCDNYSLGEGQQIELLASLYSYCNLFSEQPGITTVFLHSIDTGDAAPVRP